VAGEREKVNRSARWELIRNSVNFSKRLERRYDSFGYGSMEKPPITTDYIEHDWAVGIGMSLY
jgi:hypothetical protein